MDDSYREEVRIYFECAARRCHFRMGVKDRHFFAVVAAE